MIARVSHFRMMFAVIIGALVSGCPVRFIGTPEEELRRLGAGIETLEDRSARICLRGKDVSVGNLILTLVHCSNHSGENAKLTKLDLSRSNVSDNGLKNLRMNAHRIKELRRLDLSETDVSDDAVAQRQAAIPDCQIIR
jgi:hypothetical protein